MACSVGSIQLTRQSPYLAHNVKMLWWFHRDVDLSSYPIAWTSPKALRAPKFYPSHPTSTMTWQGKCECSIGTITKVHLQIMSTQISLEPEK